MTRCGSNETCIRLRVENCIHKMFMPLKLALLVVTVVASEVLLKGHGIIMQRRWMPTAAYSAPAPLLSINVINALRHKGYLKRSPSDAGSSVLEYLLNVFLSSI